MADHAETVVASERRESILRLTMDGPGSRNSIGPACYDALHSEILRGGADPAVRAIVIAGANGFFSSGGNVNALRESAQGTLADATKRTDKLNAMIRAVVDCPKPVIGAIEGGAAGVAVGLALACDFLVASKTAKFTVANIRVGLSPDGGTTYFLRSALPRQIVMEMCLLGTPVSAERIYEVGLINILAPEGRAMEAAMELAQKLSRGPSSALAATKRLIETAARHGLAEHLDAEAETINPARFGAEAAEGLAAFLEKRPADFAGIPHEATDPGAEKHA